MRINFWNTRARAISNFTTWQFLFKQIRTRFRRERITSVLFVTNARRSPQQTILTKERGNTAQKIISNAQSKSRVIDNRDKLFITRYLQTD